MGCWSRFKFLLDFKLNFFLNKDSTSGLFILYNFNKLNFYNFFYSPLGCF